LLLLLYNCWGNSLQTRKSRYRKDDRAMCPKSYLNVTDRRTDDLLSHHSALRYHRAVKSVRIRRF